MDKFNKAMGLLFFFVFFSNMASAQEYTCLVSNELDHLVVLGQETDTLRYNVEVYYQHETVNNGITIPHPNEAICTSPARDEFFGFDQTILFDTAEAGFGRGNVNELTLNRPLIFKNNLKSLVLGNYAQELPPPSAYAYSYDNPSHAVPTVDRDFGEVIIDVRSPYFLNHLNVRPFSCAVDSQKVVLRNLKIKTVNLDKDAFFDRTRITSHCLYDGGNVTVEPLPQRPLDNPCPGNLPEKRFYRDRDGDGKGDINNPTDGTSCTPPDGYVDDNTDCNDNPATDGAHWQNYVLWAVDCDGDGFIPLSSEVSACLDVSSIPLGSCGDRRYQPLSQFANKVDNDCNDFNSAIRPHRLEICGNHVDDNCNGKVDEGCIAIIPPPGPIIVDECLAEEICGNQKDDDCNPQTSDACFLKPMDTDGDGVNDYVDCAPQNAAIPAAAEICDNGIDDNCDAERLVDKDDPSCSDDASPTPSGSVATGGGSSGCNLSASKGSPFYSLLLLAGVLIPLGLRGYKQKA